MNFGKFSNKKFQIGFWVFSSSKQVFLGTNHVILAEFGKIHTFYGIIRDRVEPTHQRSKLRGQAFLTDFKASLESQGKIDLRTMQFKCNHMRKPLSRSFLGGSLVIPYKRSFWKSLNIPMALGHFRKSKSSHLDWFHQYIGGHHIRVCHLVIGCHTLDCYIWFWVPPY